MSPSRQRGRLGLLVCWLGLASLGSAADWPHFLGPEYQAASRETKLLHTWPKGGPKLLWQHEKGEGFAGPVVAGGRVILFHRREQKEVVECLVAATGKVLWTYAYAAPFQDRYGSGNGPRSAPVIGDGRVFTYGVSGHLHALDLATGQLLWEVDCAKEYALQENFFGHGSSPLLTGGRLIVQLGGKGNLLAAALDPATGHPLWRATHEWGSSYASPVPATIHGRECILFFAGGESRPPTGGLVCVEAATGAVLCAAPHRAEIAESVNASSPVALGDRVFVTESYGSGGELFEIGPDFSIRSKWTAGRFGVYFMTPVVTEGALIGCDGQSSRLAELVAQDVETGRELWRDDLGGRFGRSSLLLADGGALCLGEFGDLAWLSLSRKGVSVQAKAQLFHAPDTWALPALSDGLLYVVQNQRSDDGKAPRLLCYDLRAVAAP